MTDSAQDALHSRALILALELKEVWDLLTKLQNGSATCPLVALYSEGDVEMQLRAIARGVVAVCSSEASPQRIVRAVEASLEGDATISHYTLAAFAALLPTGGVTSEAFTTEERRWLALLAQGASVREIAIQTRWSERQLRRRLNGLYLRMGAINRDQAVALAVRLGLL